jgi:hypothetical protein
MRDRHSRGVLVPALGLLLALGTSPAAAQAIFGTAGDGNLAVLLPSPGTNLPTPEQRAVTGLPEDAFPHGVSVIGSDQAVIADFNRSRLHVVQVSTGTLVRTIPTTGAYDGTGTIAVSPRLDVMIGAGSTYSSPNWLPTFALIRAPFDDPVITPLAIEGHVASYQTQAIVFDRNGRAFILTRPSFDPQNPPASIQGWVNVLDPPYSSVAFRMPVENIGSGAIAITPDGNTILTTAAAPDEGRVYVFRAPFSASTVPEVLTIAGTEGLDGINCAPDGQRCLVVSAFSPRLFSIAAPFGSGSAVEEISLPQAIVASETGFEDVAISNDGQLALITGNSSKDEGGQGGGLPGLFVRAPFTRAGAQSFAVPILGGGRGAGSARFVACPPPIPPLSPEIVPTGTPEAPVTATDFLTARWSPQSYGTRFEWRINSEAFASTTQTSVERIAPRGRLDPITLFVRSYACFPEQGPSAESSSATYSLAPPGASFSASKTSALVGEEIAFTDTSSPQATAWAWFFGNAGFSAVQNPRFAFAAPGVYLVRLMATNGSGSSLSTLTMVTVTAATSRTRSARAPGPEVEPALAASFDGLRFGPGRRPVLRLQAEEAATVFLRLERLGALVVERRIALSPGESPRLDLSAFLPHGFPETLDARVVSDRPVVVRFEEDSK